MIKNYTNTFMNMLLVCYATGVKASIDTLTLINKLPKNSPVTVFVDKSSFNLKPNEKKIVQNSTRIKKISYVYKNEKKQIVFKTITQEQLAQGIANEKLLLPPPVSKVTETVTEQLTILNKLPNKATVTVFVDKNKFILKPNGIKVLQNFPKTIQISYSFLDEKKRIISKKISVDQLAQALEKKILTLPVLTSGKRIALQTEEKPAKTSKKKGSKKTSRFQDGNQSETRAITNASMLRSQSRAAYAGVETTSAFADSYTEAPETTQYGQSAANETTMGEQETMESPIDSTGTTQTQADDYSSSNISATTQETPGISDAEIIDMGSDSPGEEAMESGDAA